MQDMLPPTLLGRWEVFLNDLIEEGTLRAVAHVRRRIHTLAGFPASRQRQYGRIRARFCWPSGYQAQRDRWPALNTEGRVTTVRLRQGWRPSSVEAEWQLRVD